MPRIWIDRQALLGIAILVLLGGSIGCREKWSAAGNGAVAAAATSQLTPRL